MMSNLSFNIRFLLLIYKCCKRLIEFFFIFSYRSVNTNTSNLNLITISLYFFLRCGKLKKLILNENRLITLPDILHLLPDLEVSTFFFHSVNH